MKHRISRLRALSVLLVLTLLLTLPALSVSALSPGLSVSPDTLEFTVPVGGRDSQVITVAGAAGTLTASSDNSAVTTAVNGAQVTVTVTAGKLPAGSVDVASVTIRSSSGGQTVVPAVITIAAAGEGSTALTASPARLDLGSVAAGSVKTGVIRITASVAGTVSGTISSNKPWISTAPRSLNSASQPVTVVVKTEGLAAGETHSGLITVDAGAAGKLEIPVLVSIPAPNAPKTAISGSPFKDVPDNHWALQAISYMNQQKVMTGYADGNFYPDQLVTREQFAKVMVAALQLPLVTAPPSPSFADIDASRWSFLYIETAKPYLTGFDDGLFRPTAPAMREDIAAALVLAQGLDKQPAPDPAELDAMFSDASTMAPPALKLLVARAVNAKLMSGFSDGTFRPRESLTRAQTALMLYRAVTTAPTVTKTAPGSSGTSGQTPPAQTGVGSGTATTLPATTTPLAMPTTGTVQQPVVGTAQQSSTGTVTPTPAAPVTSNDTGYNLGSAPAAWPKEADIKVSTLAGGMARGNQDGPLHKATFSNFTKVRLGQDGAIYAASTDSVRKVANGQVRTVWKYSVSTLIDIAVTNDGLYASGYLSDAATAYYRWSLLKQGGEEDEEDKAVLSYTRPYLFWSPQTGMYTKDENIILKLSEAGKETIADSSATSARGHIVAVDEVAGKILLASGGTISELKLFPRQAAELLSNPELSRAQRNFRGGLYAYDSNKGTFYRWAPGQTAWTKLFSLDKVTYSDSIPVWKEDMVDMTVDSKGNIVLLDSGNNSIRYVQIFE